MNRYSPKYLLQQKKTVITAHSGCEGTPQDQMDSVELALELVLELEQVPVQWYLALLGR